MKRDAISIVETAYDVAVGERPWLVRLLEEAERRLDRGCGVLVSTYTPGMRPDESLVETRGMTDRGRDGLNAMVRDVPDLFRRCSTPSGHGRCVTAGQQLGLTPADAAKHRPFHDYLHPAGVRDLLGILSLDPSGHAIWLAALLPDNQRPTVRERAAWNRISTHISAGARLRRSLAHTGSKDLAVDCDAVLSPSGSVVHAEPSAQTRDMRERLRQAARAIDKARSSARANEDEALDLWEGLVAGRWSLVEKFDSDGRRYLIARKNEPHVKDPRGLTLRERQVLAYMAAGDSVKVTAYVLGLSYTAIHRHRATAMRKLRLRAVDVPKLFFPAERRK
jgi:DNA-binding CsgD family transcriptional regulator